MSFLNIKNKEKEKKYITVDDHACVHYLDRNHKYFLGVYGYDHDKYAPLIPKEYYSVNYPLVEYMYKILYKKLGIFEFSDWFHCACLISTSDSYSYAYKNKEYGLFNLMNDPEGFINTVVTAKDSILEGVESILADQQNAFETWYFNFTMIVQYICDQYHWDYCEYDLSVPGSNTYKASSMYYNYILDLGKTGVLELQNQLIWLYHEKIWENDKKADYYYNRYEDIINYKIAQDIYFCFKFTARLKAKGGNYIYKIFNSGSGLLLFESQATASGYAFSDPTYVDLLHSEFFKYEQKYGLTNDIHNCLSAIIEFSDCYDAFKSKFYWRYKDYNSSLDFSDIEFCDEDPSGTE